MTTTLGLGRQNITGLRSDGNSPTLYTVDVGGSPYVKVRDLVVDPDAVLDWGPVINTAIGDGVRAFYFEDYDADAPYPFATQIDLSTTWGIVFLGPNGNVDLVGNVLGGVKQARAYLLWEGTGSGSPFDLTDSLGFRMDQMGLYYSSASFTGRTLDLDNSCVHAIIHECDIGSFGGAHTSALCNISLQDDWINTIERCNLRGAQYNILGDIVGGHFSNAHRILDCRFAAATVGHIGGIGQQWSIRDPIFEMGSEGPLASTPSCVVPGPHSNALISSFEITGMWAGDVVEEEPWFISDDTNPWYATIQGFMQASIGPIFQFEGGGWVEVVALPSLLANDTSQPLVDLGDTGAGATAFSYFSLRGNVSNAVDAVTNRAGHRNVEIQTYEASSASLATRSVVGHERMEWPPSGIIDRPAIVAEAALGTGSPLAAMTGTDIAGAIYLQPGTSPTSGKVATITLGNELVSSPDALDALAVFLQPISGWNGTVGSAGVAAGAFVRLQPTNTATWELHVSNAIGNLVGYTYRVLGL